MEAYLWENTGCFWTCMEDWKGLISPVSLHCCVSFLLRFCEICFPTYLFTWPHFCSCSFHWIVFYNSLQLTVDNSHGFSIIYEEYTYSVGTPCKWGEDHTLGIWHAFFSISILWRFFLLYMLMTWYTLISAFSVSLLIVKVLFALYLETALLKELL